MSQEHSQQTDNGGGPVYDPITDTWELLKILNHRASSNLSDAAGAELFEVEVLWVGGEKTWENEEEMEASAPDALHSYWKERGGREQSMEDPTMWVATSVMNHRLQATDPRADEEYLVRWVGSSETSWQSRQSVPRALKRSYWARVEEKSGMGRWRFLEGQRVRAVASASKKKNAPGHDATNSKLDDDEPVFTEKYDESDVDGDYHP